MARRIIAFIVLCSITSVLSSCNVNDKLDVVDKKETPSSSSQYTTSHSVSQEAEGKEEGHI
jgi:hypothetical protein